jgi:signal transduction histidine kinase/ActR/RegA family two-component response regulator
MSAGGRLSERALVLAPSGRDAGIAAAILQEAGIPAAACVDLPCLCRELERGAALAIVVEEALHTSDLTELSRWIENQPAWSDFPFLLLAHRGGGVERNPGAKRLSTALGNVSFLERPFHPTTLVSVVRTALRGRLRQYEARERMDEIRRGETLLERRVEERTAELESANRQLASQIEERGKVESALRQAQRLEAVGQLTSGVAHDFNNLLTVVLGNVHQMQKTATDPRLVRRLAMMGEAAERGAKLTAQMLAFSRRQKLEPRVVDLNETVVSMRDLLQSTMGGSVRIETLLAAALWPAMIDPTQIELVILNLAINARDAMAVGGTLVVETANVSLGEPRRPGEPAPGDYVMVSVSDNGSGMTPEVFAKAFEPFFTTKEVGKGSGLGLSQVFGLAKQSGGGVSIDTELGQGTSVKVYLPRASAAVAEARIEVAPAVRRAQGLTVLLVDDDAAVREVSAGILDDLGYTVVEAGSGGAALEALDTIPSVEAVVLDYAMPGMNGAEVEREIKARRPSLPVLFATGYADAAALVGAGEDRIIHKPFAEGELATKLADALRARRAADGARAQAG